MDNKIDDDISHFYPNSLIELIIKYSLATIFNTVSGHLYFFSIVINLKYIHDILANSKHLLKGQSVIQNHKLYTDKHTFLHMSDEQIHCGINKSVHT